MFLIISSFSILDFDCSKYEEDVICYFDFDRILFLELDCISYSYCRSSNFVEIVGFFLKLYNCELFPSLSSSGSFASSSSFFLSFPLYSFFFTCCALLLFFFSFLLSFAPPEIVFKFNFSLSSFVSYLKHRRLKTIYKSAYMPLSNWNWLISSVVASGCRSFAFSSCAQMCFFSEQVCTSRSSSSLSCWFIRVLIGLRRSRRLELVLGLKCCLDCSC